MSFFKNLMATIGIGSATVDTILSGNSNQIRGGELLEGKVVVKGGGVSQEINEIYLYLCTSYIKEVNDQRVRETAVLEKFALNERFTIAPNERIEFPFSIQIPYETPMSIGHTRVWLNTGLDISSAVDPADNDDLKIMPSPIVSQIMDALNDLGFRLKEVDCFKSHRSWNEASIIQEFAFWPGGEFRRLEEIEVVFFPRKDKVEVLMEIDRRPGALLKLFDVDDETRIRFTITEEDASNRGELASVIANLIRRHM
jgi:sporulation-control protein